MFKRCPPLQGFQKDLFQTWQGARDIQDVVRTVTAAQAPSVVGPQGIGLYRAMITPNALREARAHFGCPQMEGVLMEERGLEVTEHWSMRHYNVRPQTLTIRHVHCAGNVNAIHYGCPAVGVAGGDCRGTYRTADLAAVL